MRIDVCLWERVLVLIDGKPQKYLGPGRYRMLVAPWRKVEVKRLDTDAMVAPSASYIRVAYVRIAPGSAPEYPGMLM